MAVVVLEQAFGAHAALLIKRIRSLTEVFCLNELDAVIVEPRMPELAGCPNYTWYVTSRAIKDVAGQALCGSLCIQLVEKIAPIGRGQL